MSLNLKGFVSWGMYAPSSSADQRANLFGSWGLSSNLPAQTVTVITRVRCYLNTLCMWFGFSRNRSW